MPIIRKRDKLNLFHEWFDTPANFLKAVREQAFESDEDFLKAVAKDLGGELEILLDEMVLHVPKPAPQEEDECEEWLEYEMKEPGMLDPARKVYLKRVK